MSARRLLAAVLIGLSLPAAARAQAPAPASSAPPLTLPALESRTLAVHPALRAAAARVDEARGLAQQAGAWTNPVIGVSADEWRPRDAPSGVFGGFIQQDVLLGAKRADARSAAAAEVALRLADVETARARVLTALRVRYYEVLAAEERLATATRLAALGDEMLVIARQLFNVGMADRPDVLASEAEAASLRAALEASRATRSAAWRRLAAAAGDGQLQPQRMAESLIDAVAPIDAAVVRARVFTDSPELRAAQAMVARERALVSVQRSLMTPDLFLRGAAGWNRESLGDGARRAIGWQFGVEVGLSLPVANRNRGGIAASLSAVTVAEAVEAQTRLELEARWATAMEEYDSARAVAESYRRDILPRSEQAYTLLLDKYREMAAPYPQVLMAQRALIEHHTRYTEALERLWRATLRVQGNIVDGF